MEPNSEFEDRLRRAVERGVKRRAASAAAQRQAELNEAELRQLHTRHRLALSEHIEQTLKRVQDVLPGFRYELVYGDRGWGASVHRDDFSSFSGQRSNRFSRLEMTVRPYSDIHVLELTAKGTIRDKEVFNRSFFEPLQECDLQTFLDRVDSWVIEFVELFTAKQ